MTKAKKSVELPTAAAIAKKLKAVCGGKHGMHDVFADFCLMGACALSNKVDAQHFEEREAEYMRVVGKYTKEEADQIAEAFGELNALIYWKIENGDFSDVLGQLFMELEIGNKWAGQFFTPYHLSLMMAKMTIGSEEKLRADVEEKEFLTAGEPACGSGGMVIALAQAMNDADVNYAQRLHVTATDVDLRCVHMAYVQLSLYGIPAVVVHGNSLSMQTWSIWYTPAHIFGLWGAKLKRKTAEKLQIPA